MAQRYKDSTSRSMMEQDLCPECGEKPEDHSDDYRFWVRAGCLLTPLGVTERIDQHKYDMKE